MRAAKNISDNWFEVKELIRDNWDEISDHEIEMIEGKKARLVSALVSKYGMTKSHAKREVNKIWL